MNLGITGATGALGTLVIEKWISLGVDPSTIVAVARNKEKAAALIAKGVEFRFGDYDKKESLVEAFKGVDRLLMISASDLGQRISQHSNVIQAAVQNNVKFIAYTSLFHADTSVSPLAEEHRKTEAEIKASGIPYTILRNNWYSENNAEDIIRAGKYGFIEAAAGSGKIRSASRKDYAEAAARVLMTEGHEGKTYELAGEAWDYSRLAETAAELHQRKVKYKAISAKKRIRHLKFFGIPAQVAEFITSLDISVEKGALDGPGEDLETLLGRKPESIKDCFAPLVLQK